MSDNRYTFFDPPRKADTTGPKLDIVEKIQEIFSGSSPANQQQTLDSEDNQLIEDTLEIPEKIQQIPEVKDEIQETLDKSVEAYTPYEYQLPKQEFLDKHEPQQTLELPKPKIVEKIEEIMTELSTQEPVAKDVPIPEVVQEVTATLTGDNQYGEQAKVASTVSKTEVTFQPPGSYPSSKPCVSITGGTLTNCESMEVTLPPILVTPVIAKIPVVLSEFQVRIHLNSIITLPERALEIKEIKKSTKITQCLLLQEPDVTLTTGDTGDLFLKGFVRKNISYTTRDCSNIEGLCGDIHHCTVDVPFNCVTTVTILTPPIAPISNTESEFQYFRKQNLIGPDFAEKDQLLSGDFSEFNQISTEYFNELPFCELVSSKILEYDEYLGRRELPCKAPFEEKEFNQIEEKMVLTIEMKLLQNQQVPLGFPANGTLTTSLNTRYLPTIEITEPKVDLQKESMVEELPPLEDIAVETIAEPELIEETFPRRNNLALLNAAVADFLDEENSFEEESTAVKHEECPPITKEE